MRRGRPWILLIVVILGALFSRSTWSGFFTLEASFAEANKYAAGVWKRAAAALGAALPRVATGLTERPIS